MSYRVILSDIEGKRSVESPENPFEEYGWAKEYVESELCSHADDAYRKACIVHPDGTREYWQTFTTHEMRSDRRADWCREVKP